MQRRDLKKRFFSKATFPLPPRLLPRDQYSMNFDSFLSEKKQMIDSLLLLKSAEACNIWSLSWLFAENAELFLWEIFHLPLQSATPFQIYRNGELDSPKWNISCIDSLDERKLKQYEQRTDSESFARHFEKTGMQRFFRNANRIMLSLKLLTCN